MLDNDPSRSLAIASVFVLHGGPNFDGNTGTDVVQTLVQSLDSSSLVAYAKLLFGMLNEVSRSTASTDSVQSNRMEGEQDNSTVEVNEEVVNSSADTAVGILNAILSAAKNTRLSGHKQLLPIVAILLVRIVCFDNNFVVGKQKQFVKSLKKECGDSSYAELETLSKYLKNGRDVLFVDNSDEDNSNTIYSDEVKTIAASSLLGLLAQFPTLSLDYSSNNEKSTDDNHKYITILDVVIAAIRFFGVNSANSFVAASSDRFSDDSTDNSESPKDIIDAATKLYFLLSLNPGAGVDNNSDEKKFYKFQQCFASFLGQAMCYILSTQDLSMKVRHVQHLTEHPCTILDTPL